MGAGASKEELVYMAVQRLDTSGIKTLHQQGASLEWRDSKGRTPLMLACSRSESFEAAHTLLQLGANFRAYAKGTEGGTPIHYAARKKLTRTVEMLINYGADPLQRNDIARNALDLAREQHSTATVRLIESRISLFSGMMRQHVLSNSLLKMLVPQWVSRIVWVVVLPVATGSPSLQLAIYPSTDAPMPTSTLFLQDHIVIMAKQDTADPKCVVQSNRTGEKYKFGSEPPGQSQVLFGFYNACNGVPPTTPVPLQAAPSVAQPQSPYYAPPPAQQPQQHAGAPAMHQPAQLSGRQAVSPSPSKSSAPGSSVGSDRFLSFQSENLDDDAALKLAIEESMRTASAERPSPAGADYSGWAQAPTPSGPAYGGWDDGGVPVPERSPAPSAAPAASILPSGSQTQASPAPSAPPIPASVLYPVIDTSPVVIDFNAMQNTPPPPTPPAIVNAAYSEARVKAELKKSEETKGGGQCVICWDAPAQAVCVPCGHIAGCVDCLTEVQEKDWGCPVCRAKIEKVIKVFQV